MQWIVEHNPWVFYDEAYWNLRICLKTPIDSQERKDKAISFFTDFMRIGLKYELFYFLPLDTVSSVGVPKILENCQQALEQVFKEDNSENYTLGRLSEYWPQLKHIMQESPSNFDGLTKVYKYDNKNNIVAAMMGKDMYIPRTHETGRLFLPIEPYFNFRDITLELHSFTNLWLSQVWNPNPGPDDEPGDLVDNRAVAYRNTPRLNSFLRDLKASALRNGGSWFFCDEMVWLMGRSYLGPDCILLDGQIIYQEDIDEGRVQLPDA